MSNIMTYSPKLYVAMRSFILRIFHAIKTCIFTMRKTSSTHKVRKQYSIFLHPTCSSMVNFYHNKIHIINRNLLCLLVCIISSPAYALVNCSIDFGPPTLSLPNTVINASLTPSSLTYSGPANKSGAAGASHRSSNWLNCSNGSNSFDAFMVWATPDSAIQFTSNGRFILPTAPGFSLRVGIATSQPPGNMITEYLTSSGRMQLKQLTPARASVINSIWLYLDLEFSGIPVKSGTYSIPQTKLARIEIRAPSDTTGTGTQVSYMDLSLNAFTIMATTATCTVNSTSLLVPFPASNINSINNTSAGSSIFTKPFNIQLSCPLSAGPNVYTTFTDNNNLSNTSDTLSLDPGSSAKGIGVQLKYKGAVIKYGPDTGMPGNTNQLLLQNGATGLVNYGFDAALVKTGAVTPGNYKATATFTMSYQ